jgi:type II secretory pathway predicted ATPase ExeA
LYYPHFGLKEPPFKITPNTDFFFSGGNRGAVLDALVYAITSGEGIVKVVGEVGSGKTMLCRMLQTILPEKIESIYLANPSVAPEDVLHAIAFELQLKLPKNADRLKVMQTLQAHLLNRHAEGKQVVIFVEEAQGMPLATLEEIRLLSNLETKQDKLLQIVLFGQPELDGNLNQPHIRQLRERITHSFHLGPLQTKDIGEYLIFRLRAAGYFGPPIFTDSAVKKLSSAAQGLVRRVNILAEKSLLAAYADNVHQVTIKHVNAAIQDSEFGENANVLKQLLASKYGLMSIVGLVIIATILVYLGMQYQQQAKVPSNQLESNAVATQQSLSASLQAAPQTKAVFKGAAEQLLEKRLALTKQWLRTNEPNTITLQIMTSADANQVEKELDVLGRQLEIDNVYLYHKKQDGLNLTVFLYGAYKQRADALLAMQALPAQLKNNHPQLRTLLGINNELEQTQ